MSDIFEDRSFGATLRRGRIRSKITLRDGAERAGIDPGNLSRLERSQLSPPKSASEVIRLCKAFEIKETSYLVGLAYQHHLSRLLIDFEDHK